MVTWSETSKPCGLSQTIVAVWFFIFSYPMIYYFKKKITYESNIDDGTSTIKKIFEI